jgi:hypothetical protein
MPDVQDFLEDAVGFEHYCSFDMAKMFTQFRIKEAHKHLAAFITHRGVFEPNVVMFGLAGAPQHAVREVGGSMAEDPRTNGIKFTEWAYQENAKGVQPPYDICPHTNVVKGSRLRPFIDDVFIKSMHTHSRHDEIGGTILRILSRSSLDFDKKESAAHETPPQNSRIRSEQGRETPRSITNHLALRSGYTTK